MKNVDSDIAKIIVKTVFYIDRMIFWFNEKPESLNARRMRNMCGYLDLDENVDKKNRPPSHNNYQCRLDIKQPSHELLEYLEKVSKRRNVGMIITHFEPAIDFVTRTQKDADAIGNYLKKRLIHNFSEGKPNKKIYEGEDGITHYWNNNKTNITLVMYCYKPSKAAEKPCSHVEYRFEGGWKSLNKIENDFYFISNILKFNHKFFWEENFVLKDPENRKNIETSRFFKKNIKRISLHI